MGPSLIEHHNDDHWWLLWLKGLTHWFLGDLDAIIKKIKVSFSMLFYWLVSSDLCYDNTVRWMARDRTDDKSKLFQVMAWCHQAPSHYLNQCWPSFMLPYGVTRPQWVKPLTHSGLNRQSHPSVRVSQICKGIPLILCPDGIDFHGINMGH